MQRRRVTAWISVLVVAAGASALAGASLGGARTREHRPPTDVLVLARGDGLAILDTAGRAGEPTGARGLVDAEGGRAITSRITKGATRLEVVDLVSDKTVARLSLGGRLVPNVLSGSGTFVALTPPRSDGATAWVPDGRAVTRLVVAATGGERRARTYRLPGNFEPEAFSTDDRTLFLIEYSPALAPTGYSVRRLDLDSGRIRSIARLEQAAPSFMRGTGRTQVPAPEGNLLYTLYTRQGPNYAHGDAAHPDPAAVHAFVHVLSLREGWAHCIDLPAPFGTGRATASAMAASPNGRRLYVADWTNGAIATIDPRRLRVLDVASVDLGDADDETFAAASAGRIFVGGNSTLVALDAASRSVIARWDAPSEIVGVAVGSSADAVYVATRRGVVALDGTMSRIDSWTIPGVAGIRALVAGENSWNAGSDAGAAGELPKRR